MENAVPEILKKIGRLKDTKSSNEKVVLLKEYLSDPLFNKVVVMTYDETLHYNINKLPQSHLRSDNSDFNCLLNKLMELSKQQGASNREKQELTELCYNSDWTELTEMICNKDLKCGIATGLINKAVPELIKTIPYMRCSNTSKLNRIKFPAMVQNKEDSLFVNVISKDDITFMTRSGGKLIFPKNCNIYKSLLTLQNNQHNVFMGELRITGENGKYLPRKEGNGIINKALAKNLNKGISLEEANRIHFICWDIVNEVNFWGRLETINYRRRFHTLQYYLIDNFQYIHTPEWKIVKSIQEAQEFAMNQIADGEEGAILKNNNSIWKDGTSSDWIKLKAGDLGIAKERECELRVVGLAHGKKGTKYENCIGSLLCSSDDDLLVVNVGTGLSDDDRFFNTPGNFMELFDNTYYDKIVTVRFNEVIQDKKGSKHRLFLPRFIEIRHDKTVADDLEYIKEL